MLGYPDSSSLAFNEIHFAKWEWKSITRIDIVKSPHKRWMLRMDGMNCTISMHTTIINATQSIQFQRYICEKDREKKKNSQAKSLIIENSFFVAGYNNETYAHNKSHYLHALQPTFYHIAHWWKRRHFTWIPFHSFINNVHEKD